MASANKKKEEAKRPFQNYGPVMTDRSTSVECALWDNEIEVNGKQITTYNVTISRSYRDDKGEWHKNLNFRPQDLPPLLALLARAYFRVIQEKATNGADF
jgi:hypothetical protein